MPDLQRTVSFNAPVITCENQSSFMCVHELDAPIFTVLYLQSHQKVQNALTESWSGRPFEEQRMYSLVVCVCAGVCECVCVCVQHKDATHPSQKACQCKLVNQP